VVLLFFNSVFSGISNTLYRQSAEYVYDIDPSQLLAVELPEYLRPVRHLRGSAEDAEDRDGRKTSWAGSSNFTAQFAYLPALAHWQLSLELEHEATSLAPWLRRGIRQGTRAVRRTGVRCCGLWRSGARDEQTPAVADADDDEGDEDEVESSNGVGRVSAVMCGMATGGELHVLVLSAQHVAVLQISDWGKISGGSRKRLRPSYRWMWRVLRKNIVTLRMQPPTRDDTAEIFVDYSDRHRIRSKSVPCDSWRLAVHAYEMLASTGCGFGNQPLRCSHHR